MKQSSKNRFQLSLIYLANSLPYLFEFVRTAFLLNRLVPIIIYNYKYILVDPIAWALTRENLSSGVCEQQKGRPACAHAQSDQHLCYSLIGKYHILTYYKRIFNVLASLCS